MTSVIFLPNPSTCTSNCTYVPNVAWSVPYNDANATGFTSVVRNCGTLLQTVPSGSTANVLTSLRTASVTNPDPILVVDVHYQLHADVPQFHHGADRLLVVRLLAGPQRRRRDAARATIHDIRFGQSDERSLLNAAGF
jgi:hypothetical protein